METTATVPPISMDEAYQTSANMMLGGRNSYEIKTYLTSRGLEEATTDEILERLEYEINTAKKNKAKKDMLYGALWCIGGLGLTMAHIGFIFWGAILFGAIQFFKGVSNL